MEIVELYNTIRPRYPEFAGKVALVTGSSMGIGQGIALRLAREGMHVIIHGREEDAVEQTVQALQALGASAEGICVDFSMPDAVDRLFEKIRENHTRLDVLVNNAADLRRADFHDATVEMLDYQLNINLRAPYLCSMQALPLIQAAKSGAIINISSVGGQRAHWPGLPYDMTKGGIEAMTRALSLDLARDSIRVNAIAPGAIRKTSTPPPGDENGHEQMGRIPFGCFGTALDVAAAVAFLASDDAAYITGHVLVVDGGLAAQLTPPGQFV